MGFFRGYALEVKFRARAQAKADLVCPYCKDSFDAHQARAACGGCGTDYHSECSSELEACGILGCEGSLSARPLRQQTRPLWPLVLGLVAAHVLGALLLFLALEFPERRADIGGGLLVSLLLLPRLIKLVLTLTGSKEEGAP